jgi:hypothetical protein
MTYFPLKRFLLFIVLVFLSGFWGLGQTERKLERHYTQAIENVYIGDTQPLFDGSLRLRDAISNNIDAYLQEEKLLYWVGKVDVVVRAGENTLLYPVNVNQDLASLESVSAKEIADENYRLMNQGLSVVVDILLEWDSPFVIFVVLLELSAITMVFVFFYRRSAKSAREDEAERQEEISRLRNLEEMHTDRLKGLNAEKRQLAVEIEKARANLEEYRQKTSKNEDAMIDEIMLLEEKVQQNIELMKQVEEENVSLKEIAGQYEERLQKGGKKSAVYGDIEKRFKTLYQNIVMHKRALENFIVLSGDMKIKVEEVIKHLDGDVNGVDIKRKVELKKSKAKIFEAIFSYNGRLYFRNLKSGKIEVLTIGSKNSQAKDMAFLEKF